MHLPKCSQQAIGLRLGGDTGNMFSVLSWGETKEVEEWRSVGLGCGDKCETEGRGRAW
jgi:hypothetical protein